MEPTGKTVVVVGATGLQGRAVTRHLLSSGWQVRALTRDPNGAPARALAGAGAQLVRARMNDRGYRADIAETRRIHPGAMSLRTWLERTGAAQIAAFLASRPTAGQRA